MLGCADVEMFSERTGKSTREHLLGVGLAVGLLAQDLARAQFQVEGLCGNGMRIAISPCILSLPQMLSEGTRLYVPPTTDP